MKIFRIVLLVFVTVLFAVNFWSIDYSDLWAVQSLWAYFRIVAALALIVVLIGLIRRDSIQKRSRRI